MFIETNKLNLEVNMPPRDALYLLPERDLLIRLMQRTGTGQRVTVRELAERAEIAVGTVGNLVSGAQNCVTPATAHAVSQAIGVDLPILFIPVGRSAPAPAGGIAPLPEQAAV
ncbi:hypothetical protein [Streptomyces sp. NPDC053048]|uniref:hypothetical protein n=1 Tax=Streptomyces sp. NPDC053048 TaxID=3365694 RepID=UPI0037D0AE14